MSITLKECYSYLVEEEKPKYCFDLYFEHINRDYKGLCITRTNPKKIKNKYELETEILWLTERKSKTEKTISPVLESMIFTISEFIENQEKSILLIDGIEYLISNNEFYPVMSFIRQIVDEISEKNAILLIPISPQTFSKQDLKMLERELEKIIPETKQHKIVNLDKEKNIKDQQIENENKVISKKPDEKEKKEEEVSKKIIKEKPKFDNNNKEKEPFSKIKCRYCKEIIEILSTKRPLTIRCPKCSKKYTLTKKSKKNEINSEIKTLKCIYCDNKIKIHLGIETARCPKCNKFLIVY